MKSIPDLIAYYRRRAVECGEEVDSVVERFNDGSNFYRQDDPDSQERARKHAAQWREEQSIARDTASYLETLQARLPA